MKKDKQNIDILYIALLSLKSERECEAFLADLQVDTYEESH